MLLGSCRMRRKGREMGRSRYLEQGFLVLSASLILSGCAQAPEKESSDERTERLQEQVALWSRMIDRRPKAAAYYSLRGQSYYELGLFEKAISDFDAELALKKNSPWALNGRAWAELALGKGKAATKDFGEVYCSSLGASGGTTYSALMLVLATKQAQGAKAGMEVAKTLKLVEENAWPEPVLNVITGSSTREKLLESLEKERVKTVEARALLGLDALWSGRRDEAKADLNWVCRTGAGTPLVYPICLTLARANGFYPGTK